MNERLTGRSRVRQGSTGLFRRCPVLILQLEYEVHEPDAHDAGNSGHVNWYTTYEWRDATVEDYIVYATSPPPQEAPPPVRREYPTNTKPLTVPRNNGVSLAAGPKGRLP